MSVLEEMRAAVGGLTAWRRLAVGVSPAARAGGLAFYPAIGIVLGAAAAAVAVGLDRVAPVVAGPGAVVLLALVSGVRVPRSPAAAAATLIALVVRIWAATMLPPPARAAALVLAPMLGAWAVVVQCYGGGPGRRGDGVESLVGRARFREFGWASLVALGVTLAVLEGIGLVVLLAVALATVGLRVWAYRRLGELPGRLLGATRELAETIVLGLLAVFARVMA